MAKTIKEIADELGVSKQAVYKRYKGKLYTVCAPYAHTEQGVLYLSEQAETAIKRDFLKNDHSNGAHTDTHTERSNGAATDTVTEAVIELLRKELEIKNEQIRELNARLAESNAALMAAQQTAQAAQALHAGTMQQLSAAAADEDADPATVKEETVIKQSPDEHAEPKKKRWQFWK